MRRRLAGLFLLLLVLLSSAEPLTAAVCAARMRAQDSTMPGMPGMPGMPESGSDQPSESPASDCPIERGIASSCVIGFSLAAPRLAMPAGNARETVLLRAASLTPHSPNLTSIFHPPKA